MQRKIRVVTTTKNHTYDPQGSAVLKAIKEMGIKHINDVKIGKHILLFVDDNASENEILVNVTEAADKFLHNDIIEEYEIIDK